LEEYPTEEELHEIRLHSGHLDTGGSKFDISKLLETLHKTWYAPEMGIVQDGNSLELHTLGWSGNEEIVGILKKSMFWYICWQMSVRGGHYYFELLGK